MQACKHCGRIMGDKAARRHEKVCEKNPNIEKSDEAIFNEPNKEEPNADIDNETDHELNVDLNDEADTETENDKPTQEDLTQEEQVTQPQAPPSFPAAMCPDTLILHENRQMFFKVIGRRIEGKIYIEEVKLMR